MASQVQPILVKLGIEGYEELAKLKNAFRGLDTTLNQSDAALEKARKAILDYGKSAQNSEATLKGLEAALKGVRAQATLQSPVYTQLTRDIEEVSKAQREYIADLNGTVSAYNQLRIAEEGAMRRAKKLADIQELATAANPLVVAGRRQTEFGDVPQAGRGQGGVFIAPPFRSTPYSPGTQYDRPIGPQPVSQQVKAAERGVADALDAVNAAVERGLNERAKLQEKYRQREYDQLLEGLDLEGKARKRAFDAELADFDRRLGIAERKRRNARRITAQSATQIAGAAISGGIFGGPEGFLGGLAGGALGGVSGAFAGAAIGAQVAGFRQVAGGAAEYAAAINQQRRALEGVIDDNSAYQQSLAFIDYTSRQLAIPQEQVTRNFTRLSAAVIGAGGNVDLAQEAFDGIAAGIRGTGGSLADLDGALLATAQVFSKGKVSAEELRGQIGERLPGAIDLFAKSIGKTPQELDKLLENGEVGLNDFLAFVRKLSADYGQQARGLATSTEAAGDRLAVAFGRLQEDVGEALVPIGAQFQELFGDFLEDVAPLLISTLPKIGKAALGLAENIDVLVGSLAALTAGAIVNSIVRVGGLTTAFLRLKDAIVATRLALLANPWVALATGIAAATVGLVRYYNKQREFNDLIREGKGSTRELNDAKYQLTETIRKEEATLRTLKEKYGETGRSVVALDNRLRKLREQLAALDRTYTLRLKLEREGYTFDKDGKALTYTDAEGNVRSVETGAVIKKAKSTTEFPSYDPEKKTEKKGPTPPKDRTLELQQELVYLQKINAQEVFIEQLRRRGQELNVLRAEYSRQDLDIQYEQQKALANANYEGERIAINKRAVEKSARAALDLELKKDALDKERFDRAVANSQAVQDAAEPIREAQAARQQELDNAKEFGRLVSEGILPAEAERLINYNNLVKSLIKQQEEELKLLETKLLQLETSNLSADIAEGERKKIQEQIDLINKKKKAITGAAAAGPGPAATDADRVQSAIDNIRGELNNLTNIANIVINSANLIGDAFAGAFEQLVTGAGSAREVLSNFFKDVAQGFLKMATQIIAKQITMLILQTALKALGAVTGGGSSFKPFGADNPVGDFAFGAAGPIPADTEFPRLAKGGAFNRQGYVERYARGGVISRPTMFQFAKGGSFAPGLMGEAGPEAILPLQRTPNGRLGVTMAMPRQGAPALRESMDRSRSGGGGATVMNMSFQTTRFMDREWVDREQLEAAMAKATKDGGAQGERRALAKLQNSPRTRSRLALR